MSKDLFFDTCCEGMARILTQVEDGDRRALNVYAQIKKTKDLFAEAEKQVFDQAMNEALDYPEKKFEEEGFTFEKRNGATRYSYKNIPDWISKNLELKSIEATHKQAYLAMQKNILVADQNGEEFVYPTVTTSKDSLIVKKNSTLATH